MPANNIIIFGESGAGKSSVVNMFAKNNPAAMSSGIVGCTFQSTPYNVQIGGTWFVLHDTAGLDEGEGGRVPKTESIVKLYQLLRRLEDGLCLIIFCVRGRLRNASKNWKLFYEIVCQSRVPILMAITGLEQEKVMDDWWPRNKYVFDGHSMIPTGVACITATRGKERRGGFHVYDEEYEASQVKLGDLICRLYLQVPLRVLPVEWFKQVTHEWVETKWCRDDVVHRDIITVKGSGVHALMNELKMSEQEAESLAKLLAPI